MFFIILVSDQSLGKPSAPEISQAINWLHQILFCWGNAVSIVYNQGGGQIFVVQTQNIHELVKRETRQEEEKWN